MSKSQRYNFIFNFPDLDKTLAENESLAEYEFTNAPSHVTVSVSATNERRAMMIAAALMTALKESDWAGRFREIMDSGEYETEIIAE